MKRLLPLTSALALILTASTNFAAEQTNWGQLKQSITQNGQPAFAAKRSRDSRSNDLDVIDKTVNNLAVMGTVDDDGGIYTVIPGGALDLNKSDLKIRFKVPEGAVSDDVRINMSVTGSKASDLEVVFGPSGLIFNEPCTLIITLGGAALDLPLEEIVPYHVHGNGLVDQAGIKNVTVLDDGRVRIKIAVLGFSRYGLSGGF